MYRYRSTGPVQAFAVIRFDESTFAKTGFNIFDNPDPTAGGLAASANPRVGGWFYTYVLADAARLYTIVFADKTLGVHIYTVTISSTMPGEMYGKISGLTTATSAYTEM